MKLNLFIVLLLALTVILQALNMYQGQRGPKQPSVTDAKPGVMLTLDGLPRKGRPDAAVAMVEFSDYECPFCARYTNEVSSAIQKKFVDAGKIDYYFANNPLAIHRNAEMLAIGAVCAGASGHYWEMHDRIFQEHPRTRVELVDLALRIGITSPVFGACLDSGTPMEIPRDQAAAKRLGFDGTPSFAIGLKTVNGQVSVKKLILGAQPEAVFEKTLADVLLAVRS